uniref:Uncharacterized protein n=1 Tax=Octopus bimaculoides TaxID=37653 RepID=A0A0L8FMQ7_OCTBM
MSLKLKTLRLSSSYYLQYTGMSQYLLDTTVIKNGSEALYVNTLLAGGFQYFCDLITLCLSYITFSLTFHSQLLPKYHIKTHFFLSRA